MIKIFYHICRAEVSGKVSVGQIFLLNSAWICNNHNHYYRQEDGVKTLRYVDRCVRTSAIVVLAVMVIAAPVLASWPVYALSGNGTALNPYLITSCADFKDIAEDLTAEYRLMKDIDCSADGDSITIGDDFSAFMGVLDGNNKKITIAINNTNWPHDVAGLFNYLGGTVTDLTIDGSIITDVMTGTLAGYAEYSTVENVTVLAEVTGGNRTGGLIGEADNSTISDVTVGGDVSGNYHVGGVIGFSALTDFADAHYNGTVTATGYAGGLIGYNMETEVIRASSVGSVQADERAGGLFGSAESAVAIATSQSFSLSNVTATTEYGGGLSGELNGDYAIQNSYARGNVMAGDHAGGIAGSSRSNTIINVYSSGTITSPGDRGGIVATDLDDNTTIVDSFWNAQAGSNPDATGGTTLTGDVSGISGIALHDYQQYTGNEQLSAPWDFATIWGINGDDNDGLPFLRWQGFEHDPALDQDGVRNTVEDAAPNGGDSNNDGTPDAEQSNVVSIVNSVIGSYVTIALSGDDCNFNRPLGGSVAAVSASSLSGKDNAFAYPGGFLDFTAICQPVSSTVNVSVYFYGLDDAQYAARKYSPATEAYFAIPGATITTQTIGGQKVYVVSYAITDGGMLDDDGTENGQIVDPIGLGVPLLSAPNTGLGKIRAQ